MHVATGCAGEAQQECLQSRGPLQRGHPLRCLPLPVPRECSFLGRRVGPYLQGREWVALAGRTIMALLTVAKTQRKTVHTCSQGYPHRCAWLQLPLTANLLEGEMIIKEPDLKVLMAPSIKASTGRHRQTDRQILAVEID